MEDYGINRNSAHPKVLELIQDDFFWDNSDEFAPFGSDEGDTALDEFRNWRAEHPTQPLRVFLEKCLQDIAGISASVYISGPLDEDEIERLAEEDYEDTFTIDITIIATCFGQFVDEGIIDTEVRKVLEFAIDRQIRINAYLDQEDFIDKLRKLLGYLPSIFK